MRSIWSPSSSVLSTPQLDCMLLQLNYVNGQPPERRRALSRSLNHETKKSKSTLARTSSARVHCRMRYCRLSIGRLLMIATARQKAESLDCAWPLC